MFDVPSSSIQKHKNIEPTTKMSSLSSSSPVSQEHLLLRINSRKMLFHIPHYQSNVEANPPLSSNNHDTLDPYSKQSNFDANVIIVLSLLVCGIICSIGVNFIVKCALRCISSPHSPSAQVPNMGVEKKVLKMFTTLKYTEGVKLPGLDTECVICLSEFRNGEKVRVLPKCNHGFHVRCIDRWLGLHSTCPTCRNSLIGICQKIVPTPEIRETVLSFTPLTQDSLVCHQTPQ